MNRAWLLLFFVLLSLPLYFMLVGSFEDVSGFVVMPPPLVPPHPTLQNYSAVMHGRFLVWLSNTAAVVAVVTLTATVTEIMAGYAFAWSRFRFKRALWVLLLIGIMLPRISVIIPLYIVVRKLALSGTLLAASLPVAFSPVGMYLARNYFRTIPASVLESARMDGASELRILSSIVVPMSRPLVTLLALFASIAGLQDFIWQILVLQEPDRQTLLVGLIRLAMQRNNVEIAVNPIGRSFAVGVILLAPLLLIFAVANRYFTGALGGAVKE